MWCELLGQLSAQVGSSRKSISGWLAFKKSQRSCELRGTAASGCENPCENPSGASLTLRTSRPPSWIALEKRGRGAPLVELLLVFGRDALLGDRDVVQLVNCAATGWMCTRESPHWSWQEH